MKLTVNHTFKPLLGAALASVLGSGFLISTAQTAQARTIKRVPERQEVDRDNDRRPVPREEPRREEEPRRRAPLRRPLPPRPSVR